MKRQIPKVSVITVVYNDVKHIESTIKNVLNQDYENLEYIIVDGGSSDGTLDIVKKYEKRIFKFISEPDKGLYDAMNKGTLMATGEWIIFRNSGDYFLEKNSISKTFEHYIDEGEDLLCGEIRMFNNYGYKDFNVPLLSQISYWDRMPFWHPSTYIRRTCQLKEPYDIRYKNSADFKFFLKILINGASYKVVDQVVALFNTIEGNTANNYIKTLQNNLNIFKELGADEKYIHKYEKAIARYRIYKYIGRFSEKICAVCSVFRRYRLNRKGWVESNISDTLKDI